MNHNLKLLSIYDSRLKQIGDEITLLACSVHQFSSATAIALDVSLRHLTHARKRLYDETFVIVVGAKIQFSPDTNLPRGDLNPTITSIIVSPFGSSMIGYSTGMVDTEESLREKLLSGLATISGPAPEISLGKNEG